MNQHRRFYLITYPRSASNLLVRILNLKNQPDVEPRPQHAGYFFMHAMSMRWEKHLSRKNIDDWTEEETKELKERYQKCVDEFVKHLDDAESHGKMTFNKEHAFFIGNPTDQWQLMYPETKVKQPRWEMQIPSRYAETQTYSDLNNTVLPDEFLRLFRPIFLIRHPAMMFPSLFRATRDLNFENGPPEERKVSMNALSVRRIYDWFVREFEQAGSASSSSSQDDGTWPVILDADDVINNPAVILRLCDLTGLDKTKLCFEWEQATPDEANTMHPTEKRMLSTLRTSNGIMKDKSAGTVDIDAEAKKWREEFGEEEAAMLEQCVHDAMPHYDFMKARRLQA